MAEQEADQYVPFSELALVENILKGQINSLRQESDFLKLIMVGVIIVLFVGYATMLVALLALVFSFLN